MRKDAISAILNNRNRLCIQRDRTIYPPRRPIAGACTPSFEQAKRFKQSLIVGPFT